MRTRRILPPPDAIPADYRPVLAGCFRSPALRPLLEGAQPAFILEAVQGSGLVNYLAPDATLLDALSLAFDWMRRYHRSDYVYRHALTTKVFLGRHSPESTSLLPELRVGERKADMVMLNGTSWVYEIKTARDNLDRLPGQLSAYLQMFDRVSVLADSRHVEAVRAIAPPVVGILALTERYTIQTIRSPTPNAGAIDASIVFDTLRTSEYVAAVRELRGFVPDARPVDLYGACKAEFVRSDPAEVHAAMVRILKKRRRITRADLAGVPECLVSGFVEGSIEPRSWATVVRRLSEIPASTSTGEVENG